MDDPVAKLLFYFQKKENFRISLRHKWEIIGPSSGSYFIPRFIAKKWGCEKQYFCQVMYGHDREYLPIYEECKKYNCIVSLEEQITISDITYLFYEKCNVLENPIDEKKLLKMFIELNKINLAGSRDLPGSKIMIYYCLSEIVFKDGRYQIYPSSAYNKDIGREEYMLATEIFRVFKYFNLSLTNKIENIETIIKEKEQKIHSSKKHFKYLAENNLNNLLKELI